MDRWRQKIAYKTRTTLILLDFYQKKLNIDGLLLNLSLLTLSLH